MLSSAKYLSLPFLFFLFLFKVNSPSHAQETIDIRPFIDAWKIKDGTQTIKFEETIDWGMYSPATGEIDTDRYRQVLKTVRSYLKKHPDDRIETRALMFESVGKELLLELRTGQESEQLLESMAVAQNLDDGQLLSELYSLYAELHKDKAEYLFYTIKSAEIQERLGKEKSPRYYNSLFNLSAALYRSNNFKESIAYGKKFLDTKNIPNKIQDDNVYIYQYDLLGANYLKLEEYDRAILYYTLLLDTLAQRKAMEPDFQKLWTGIAKGSIGIALFGQGKVEESLPLLQDCLQNSIETGSWSNVAMAQNVISQISYDLGEYETALAGWKKAHHWTLDEAWLSGPTESRIFLRYNISNSIADTYRKLNIPDSAFGYYETAHAVKQKYDADINSKNLEFVSAKLEFENIQNNLDISRQKLKSEKKPAQWNIGEYRST